MRILLKLCILTICIFTIQVTTSSKCPEPHLKNGRFKLRSDGRRVKYYCRRGFQLYGRRSAYCNVNNWTNMPPLCIAPGCPSITNVSNGDIEVKYGGAMLIFSCSTSHDMQGKDTLICDGNSWNHDKPICIAATAITECDFETEGLCGWKQNRNDDFDWTWHVGTTATGYTDPSHDHSTGVGSDDGHYLYIETSSPREEGDQASLLSPLYPPDNTQLCFTFWYHMLGPEEEGQVGALKVYVQPEGTSWDSLTPVFYADGNKGDVWLKGEMFIEKTDKPFQIVIVAQKKVSYLSDIAIDDVSLRNCSDISTEAPGAETKTHEEDGFDWTSASSLLPESYSRTPVSQTVIIPTEAESTQTTSKLHDSTVFQSLVTIGSSKRTLSTRKTLAPNSTIGYPQSVSLTSGHPTLSTQKSSIAQKINTTWQQATEPIPSLTAMGSKSSTTPQSSTTITTKSSSIELVNTANPSETTDQKTVSGVVTKLTTISAKTPPTKSTELSTSWSKSTSKAIKIDTSTVMDVFASTSGISTEKQSISSSWTYYKAINSTANVSDVYVHSPINNQSDIIHSTRSYNATESIVLSDGERITNEDKFQPLIIGIGVAIAAGLVVIVILVFFLVRNHRLKIAAEKDEEMAPIAKHGSLIM